MNPASQFDATPAAADKPTSYRTRAALVLATAATAVSLSACMVGPNYKTPAVPVPSTYAQVPTTEPTVLPTTRNASTQPTADLTHWWATFGDERLNSLIDRTMAGNLDLKTAAARIREARATYGFTSSDLYPTVTAGGSYTRSRSSAADINRSVTVVPNGSGGSTTINSGNSAFPERDSNSYGFDASWELDVWGRVRRNMEAARYDIEAQEANRDALITSLLAEVARNYIDLRGFQREVRIAQENAKSQADTLGLTRARFNAGLASDLDVARAEAQVASTESTIPNLETSINQSIHRLSVLTGEAPGALLDELTPHEKLPYSLPTVPVGLPSDLLRRRPDIRQAERNLAASTALIGAAEADYFPRFTLTGSLGVSSSRFERLFRTSAIDYSFGPAVSWPIFDANRIKFNVEVQNQRQQENLNTYKQTVLLALEDVEDSLVAFNQEQVRHKSLEQAVAANRRAVDLSTQLYNKGLAAFLDVLDAQRSLFVSEDALVSSDRIVAENLIAVYKALGGGWEPAHYVPESKTNPKGNIGIGP